jgi:hypothetical protein
VLTDHGHDTRHGIAASRHVVQHLRMHGLDVPGPIGRHHDRPRRHLRHRIGAGIRRQIVLNDGQRAAFDLRHDLVDLDRVREMMDEVDERHQAHEKQHKGHRHGQPRVVAGTLPTRDADGVEPGRAVGERGDEDAQHDLIRPVPKEVAQQPRRKLCRRQLQRDDGEAEHQRDHRGHRAGDRDQQRPRVVRRPLEQQLTERRVRRHLDQRQRRPREQGEHHRQRRQRPQRPSQVFPDRLAPHRRSPVPSLALGGWGVNRRGARHVPVRCSGRIGTRRSGRPVACRIAAAIAGPDEIVGGSPTPRTP